MFKSAEKTKKMKRDKYDAFAQRRGTTLVALVIEANCDLSVCAQKYQNKSILRNSALTQ